MNIFIPVPLTELFVRFLMHLNIYISSRNCGDVLLCCVFILWKLCNLVCELKLLIIIIQFYVSRFTEKFKMI